MTAQDTDNQAGGAEPSTDPAEDSPEAPAPAGSGEQPEEPQADEVNPVEALRDSGIKFIIAARRLGFDPKQTLHEILESIKD